MTGDSDHTCAETSREPPLPRFWEEFHPVAERAFGVWTHRDPAVEWARDAWKALIYEGLVPKEEDGRDDAVALVTLLALASVYRDFCMAAFDEVSYLVDLAYAAEDASLGGVPERAIARLAGELHIDTDGAYDDLMDMLEGLVRWRRPEVAAALIRHLGPHELFRQLWVTCLSPEVFEDADGEPLSDSERNAILAEPWDVGAGSSMPAYAWVTEGCPLLGT